MILWFILALMTAAAAFAVVWPLGRKPGIQRSGSDLLVYGDQLEEIDRDRAAGLIGEAEAEAARVEVSRRLLAAADTPPAVPFSGFGTQPSRRHRTAAFAAVVILALVPLGLYVALGSPDVPAQPASARAETPPGERSLASLVDRKSTRLNSSH